MFTDLRFAVRQLWKKPSLTAIVVVTLALGIGAGGAMFSLIHSLLVRPVDFPGLDRLVSLQATNTRGEWDEELSPRDFLDLVAESRSFSRLAAMQGWGVTLSVPGGVPEKIVALQVSPGFFEALEVPPALGRWFAADEVDGQNVKVAILKHDLWQRRFAGDPGILGRAVQLDGASYTVVGVLPKDFALPGGELFAPLTLDAEQRADRKSRYLEVLGRLAPGATLAGADAEVRAFGERMAAADPDASAGRRLRALSLVGGMVEDFTKSFIYLLFAAALFVLLIACANVANVFLADAVTRRRELAVRTALGAGRGRIVRQLLVEASLLGLCGGVASLLFADWALALIKAGLPPTTTRFIAGWDRMGVDGVTLGFAVAAGVLVGLLFGVVPAIQVSRTDVQSVLKDGERGGSGGPRAQRLRSLLVVAQVALALVLLIGAGAMVQGFRRVAEDQHGIDARALLTMRVKLGEEGYATPERRRELVRRVLADLSALPGVSAAAVTFIPWASGGWTRIPEIEGRVERPEERTSVDYRPATAGYIELLGVPRVEGRTLRPEDEDPAAPRVAVVTRAMAARFWPGQSAIGKRLRFDAQQPWRTVVGVVDDVEERVGERGARPLAFVPYMQEPSYNLYFTLRGGADPARHARAALAILNRADPTLAADEVRTLHEARDERLAGLRLGASMMTAFALLALLLAVIGSYGVSANLVSQRTHEIGVRMALGARGRDVLALVLRRGLLLTAAGAALGVAGGVALVKLVDSMLVGLVAGGAGGVVLVTAIVAGCSLAGCFVPARRATRVDPLVALRAD